MRWPAVLALATFLLLTGWLTGNVIFTHPSDMAHHPETISDLQCTFEGMANGTGLFCLLAGGLATWACLIFGQHRSEQGARRCFCGWNSSSYKEFAFHGLRHVCPGCFSSWAFLFQE
jgi:hypothetical protein